MLGIVHTESRDSKQCYLPSEWVHFLHYTDKLTGGLNLNLETELSWVQATTFLKLTVLLYFPCFLDNILHAFNWCFSVGSWILAHLCLLSTIRLQVIPLCFSEVFILSDCATTLLQNWANVCQGKQAVHWFYSDFLFCHLKSIQLPKAQLVSLF